VIYASRTPRDLNHDPKPYTDESGRHATGYFSRDCRPHPEFDHVQHNEPNPILVSFRANDQHPDAQRWADSLRQPSLSSWHNASPDHIEHARRVLERLAYLPKEES
jgi:hypothetical protein